MATYETMAELFQDPSRHTKHAFARDSKGIAVSDLSDEACSWCLWGAAFKIYRTQKNDPRRYDEIIRLLDNTISNRTPFKGFIAWQDDPNTTPQMVYELCKEMKI